MLLYATLNDLLEWDPQLAPANATSLIRQASVLVARATRAAVYPVGTDGKPTSTTLGTALTEAVCAQVEMWAAAGIDPTGAGVALSAPAVVSTSRTLDGRSESKSYADLSTSVTVQQARAVAATQLCMEAWSILSAAGLTSGQPGGC